MVRTIAASLAKVLSLLLMALSTVNAQPAASPWSEVKELSPTGVWPTVALASDTLHATWLDKDTIYWRSKKGEGEWSQSALIATPPPDKDSMADIIEPRLYANSAQPCIVYQDFFKSVFMPYQGQKWGSAETVVEARAFDPQACELNGTPCVLWREYSSVTIAPLPPDPPQLAIYSLRYAVRTASGWTQPAEISPKLNCNGFSCCPAEQGGLHMAWTRRHDTRTSKLIQGFTGKQPRQTVEYFHFEPNKKNSAPSITLAATEPDPVRPPQLAASPHGDLIVLWMDRATPAALFWRTRTNEKWSEPFRLDVVAQSKKEEELGPKLTADVAYHDKYGFVIAASGCNDDEHKMFVITHAGEAKQKRFDAPANLPFRHLDFMEIIADSKGVIHMIGKGKGILYCSFNQEDERK